MPIDVSNVMLFCPKCNRGVRIGHRFTDDGQKQRYCKSCGQPGQHRPTQAGPRRHVQEEILIKINLFSRRRHTKQKTRHAAQ